MRPKGIEMANFNISDFRSNLDNIAASYKENSGKLWLSYKVAVNRALDSQDFEPLETLETLAETARKDSQKDFLTALRAGNNVVRAIAYGKRVDGKAVKYRISSAAARTPLAQAAADMGKTAWHSVRDDFKDFFQIKVVVTPAKRSKEERLIELAAEAGKLIGGDKTLLENFIKAVTIEAATTAKLEAAAKAEKAKTNAANKLEAARAAAKAA